MDMPIDKTVVANYYINCELGSAVDGVGVSYRADTYSGSIMRMLEALSFTYRANSVFDYVASDRYSWELREVPVDSIVLTGMGDKLTGLIYSDIIQQNPRKMINYIKSHRSDPMFDELSSEGEVPKHKRIVMLRESDGILKMLDGSHRLIAMAMNGVESVQAYIAHDLHNGELPFIGDATFLRLRKLWEQTDDKALRASIEQTVAGMMRMTKDGRSAVQAYWVDMAPNDDARTAGVRLVDGNA